MPKPLTITYYPWPSKDPQSGDIFEVFRPTIPIVLVYKSKSSWDMQALVDSGSDRNLFPAQIGEYLGIDVKSGDKKSIGGIGNYELIAYTHKVKILVAGKIIDTEVDFSYDHNQKIPLLGRNGFFDSYKDVVFNEGVKSLTFKS